jgi:hypothetical protein
MAIIKQIQTTSSKTPSQNKTTTSIGLSVWEKEALWMGYKLV